ncbi:unnamed protein product, partial [Prorocentrum cordatum]
PSPRMAGRRALALFGPPGSGKSTHGARICELLGLGRASMGDLLRGACATAGEVVRGGPALASWQRGGVAGAAGPRRRRAAGRAAAHRRPGPRAGRAASGGGQPCRGRGGAGDPGRGAPGARVRPVDARALGQDLPRLPPRGAAPVAAPAAAGRAAPRGAHARRRHRRAARPAPGRHAGGLPGRRVVQGALEGAKFVALRASRFGSDSSSSSSSPLGGGARARSYSRFALRAARSAKREVRRPW